MLEIISILIFGVFFFIAVILGDFILAICFTAFSILGVNCFLFPVIYYLARRWAHNPQKISDMKAKLDELGKRDDD